VNTNQIIEDLLTREGEGTPPYLNKNDAGGRTSWGISERAHPEAWRPGPPTREQAAAIYRRVYIAPFFALAKIPSTDRLVAVLIDDAVMSGVSSAIKRLQFILGLEMDGIIGPKTIQALKWFGANDIIVQRYVVERAVRISRLVQQRPSDLPFLTGWITRILSFLPEVK
jgi:lysozyme family protein